MATSGLYYIDTLYFSAATAVYSDASLSTKAADGYYSFNNDNRQQVSGVLGSIVACPTGTTLTNYFTLNYADSCLSACTSAATPVNTYGITTTCANGSPGQYTITGATIGDNIEVTATFSGAFIALASTYNLNTNISSYNDTNVTGSSVSSTCYPYGSSNTWSISVSNTTYVHFVGTSKIITISAVAQNYSTAYGQNVNIHISKINGVSTNVGYVNGCYFNSGGAGCTP